MKRTRRMPHQPWSSRCAQRLWNIFLDCLGFSTLGCSAWHAAAVWNGQPIKSCLVRSASFATSAKVLQQAHCSSMHVSKAAVGQSDSSQPTPHHSPCVCVCCVHHRLMPPSLSLQQKRVASFRTRTFSTVAMIAGFLVIIYLGHVPLVLLVLTLQVSVGV